MRSAAPLDAVHHEVGHDAGEQGEKQRPPALQHRQGERGGDREDDRDELDQTDELAWAAAKGVKGLVERGRPRGLLGGVEVRESGIQGAGYVSGHTAVAFALATVVAPLVPRGWRWAPFALATVVGLSRIYFGAHLPLDVIGGAGLGLVCGVVAWAAGGMVPTRRR